MAEYPAHLTRECRLLDGRTVTIRPISPEDGPRERAFLDALSGESRYLRFHEWVNAPTDTLIHFLTDVDYDRHMAFVCVVPNANQDVLIGEARYAVDPNGTSCDFGIVIADSWHKTGVAGMLMDALIGAARTRGLEKMEGIVLNDNKTMLRFARSLGFEVGCVPDDPRIRLIVKEL